MNKTKLIAKVSAASAITAALASTAFAQSYDYSSSGTSTAAAAGVFAFLWIFILIAAVIGIVTLIFWIFMLIDAFKRTNWKDDSQKTTWLVVLIVSFLLGLHFIGALVYYFAVRRPLGKAV